MDAIEVLHALKRTINKRALQMDTIAGDSATPRHERDEAAITFDAYMVVVRDIDEHISMVLDSMRSAA